MATDINDINEIRRVKPQGLKAPKRSSPEIPLDCRAPGSIGSELCRQIAAARPASLVLLDRYENSLFHIHNELTTLHPGVELSPVMADVADARRIDQVFGERSPHVVFHAAAHKHVPLMEDNLSSSGEVAVDPSLVVLDDIPGEAVRPSEFELSTLDLTQPVTADPKNDSTRHGRRGKRSRPKRSRRRETFTAIALLALAIFGITLLGLTGSCVGSPR